jgi:hypothetical protein
MLPGPKWCRCVARPLKRFSIPSLPMMYKQSTDVIGYSGFDLLEECYEYNEDACYIADSVESAESFVEDSLGGTEDARIDAVTIAEIMNDYGASEGEFAMEPAAFRRFSAIAAANGIQFRAAPYDDDETLMVVEVEGVTSPDDDA